MRHGAPPPAWAPAPGPTADTAFEHLSETQCSPQRGLVAKLRRVHRCSIPAVPYRIRSATEGPRRTSRLCRKRRAVEHPCRPCTSRIPGCRTHVSQSPRCHPATCDRRRGAIRTHPEPHAVAREVEPALAVLPDRTGHMSQSEGFWPADDVNLEARNLGGMQLPIALSRPALFVTFDPRTGHRHTPRPQWRTLPTRAGYVGPRADRRQRGSLSRVGALDSGQLSTVLPVHRGLVAPLCSRLSAQRRPASPPSRRVCPEIVGSDTAGVRC